MKIQNIQNYNYTPVFQGQREKFIEQILDSETPKKIKILASDVERICESLGFTRNKKRGSHMSFKISETENIAFVTPHNNKNEISATEQSNVNLSENTATEQNEVDKQNDTISTKSNTTQTKIDSNTTKKQSTKKPRTSNSSKTKEQKM